MTRSPHRTRPNPDDKDDDAKKEKREKPAPVRDQMALARRLLQPIEPLDHEYVGDEEKKQVYTNLIRLKAARNTNRECADLLGVSPRTIDNYKADPYYAELLTLLETDAKQSGYHTIAEVIPDALAVTFDIMMHAPSDFVRYKAAELLLNYAGYGVPRESAQQNNRDAVQNFFRILEERDAEARAKTQQPVQVNVQINLPDGNNIVESSQSGEQLQLAIGEEEAGSPGVDLSGIPEELRQYYQPLEPGGKLPTSFL